MFHMKQIRKEMKNKLKQVLAKYNIQNTPENNEKLCKFVEIMKKYNEKTNITAITNDEDIVYKHLLDSLLPINTIENNTQILDIGCGAGFPSIPLSIMNSKLKITAIDSVRKKTDFVNLIKNELNLTNLSVIHTRIEDFSMKNEFREQFDIVTSRAVAPLNIIIEYSAPMLKNGGHIYAYKGSNYKEEIEIAKNALKILDCQIEEIFEYQIEEINTTRYLLKIRKNSKISTKYPRKQNKPRLQPL